jgi:hypothetical protein
LSIRRCASLKHRTTDAKDYLSGILNPAKINDAVESFFVAARVKVPPEWSDRRQAVEALATLS